MLDEKRLASLRGTRCVSGVVPDLSAVLPKPRARAAAKKGTSEDLRNGQATPSVDERGGATSPKKTIEDENSRKPVGSALGRLNLFPPPLERPRQFVPTEDD